MTNIRRRYTGGCWKWKAYLGSGSRKRPVGTFHEDPAEAYASFLEAKKREEELPRRIMTLGEAAEALLRRTELECSQHTLRGRKARVKRFFDDDDAILSRGAYAAEVTANDIREALKLRQTRHGVLSNTIIDDWAFLHAIFREAGFPDTRNPVREVRKPKRSMVRMQFFTRDELDEILGAIRGLSAEFPTAEADADLIEVFTYAGFRNLELSRLRIDGIEFAPPDAAVGGYFKVKRKRGGVCSHPFAKRLVPVLERLIVRARLQHGKSYQGGLLGSDELKTSLLIAGTCKNWKNRLTKRGIKSASRLSARSLRHSYGTDLVRCGASIKVVQELMGHSNLSSTQRYIHAVNTDVEEAIVTAHR